MFWKLYNVPRIELMTLPTPMEKLINLSRELGVDIYVKRDDVMELAMGGNKVRKLEFILADVLRKGCDTVITRGSYFSNHVRLTAAAARKLGLEVFIVTYPPYDGYEMDYQGNALLNMIFGAKIVHTSNSFEADEKMIELSEELSRKGFKPYVIPVGGSNPLGVLGYAHASLEIMEQARSLGFNPNIIIHATGTGTTQAGLILGLKLIGVDNVRVIGVDVEKENERVLKNKIIGLVNEASSILNVNVNVDDNDIEIEERYSFNGYGRVSGELIEFIEWVARREGLLLDPVYTGKAFYALIDMIRNREIEKDAKVVFIHTGGLPLVFQFRNAFIKTLR
ncbi:MAG: D-cysteine desulfhydrase family protein [Desulfurococcaceae archaeon]